MDGENQRPEDDNEKSRRFRIARKVKEAPIKTDAERAMEELEQEDDADRGTVQMNREVNRGCGSCLNVTLLLFVIMIASILGTCYMRKTGM